jgi:hypothetical protein
VNDLTHVLNPKSITIMESTSVTDVSASSFKYLTYKAVEWYLYVSNDRPETSGVGTNITSQDVAKLNKENNFTKSKLLLLPFFVVLAGNGGTDQLHHEFGPFYATSQGPISERLIAFFESDIPRIQPDLGFAFSSVNGSLQITHPEQFNKHLEVQAAIKAKIDKSFINLRSASPELIKFSDFELLVMCHQFESSFVHRIRAKDFEIAVSEIKQDGLITFLAHTSTII